ncbi:MAG: heme-binding protein [Planctomycetota bacterium]
MTIAIESESFKTLAKALQSTGLVAFERVKLFSVNLFEGRARVAGTPPAENVPARPTPVRTIVATAIERGAPRFNDGQVSDCIAIYEVAARALLEIPSLTVLDRVKLTTALDSKKEPAAYAKGLRLALDAAVENESFRPLVEAPLPKGFPMPGPLGRAVVKSYPRYRAARAEGRGTFWTLFSHIKKNDVQMTAPVEMTMDDSMRAKNMAFLYEGPEQGATGRQGRVAVLDLEPVKVLSFGMRGMRSPAAVKFARKALLEQARRDGWQIDGEWRLMGYNSPMVPAARRFWELQVPVRPRAPGH